MCTQFARCGVVGKHGNSHRFVPIFHCLINRPYNPLIQIFNSELFQLKIPLMPCLVTGFDMQIDKVIRPKCFQCSSNLVFIICIIKSCCPLHGDATQSGIISDSVNQIDSRNDRTFPDNRILLCQWLHLRTIARTPRPDAVGRIFTFGYTLLVNRMFSQ